MLALLLSLLANPTVLAVLAGLGGILFAFIKGDRRGAARERQKHAQDRLKAREVADDIEDAIAGRSPDENRKKLKRWSRSS